MIKVVKYKEWILSSEEVNDLELWLNKQSEYNIQNFSKREVVYFYDDDNEFYFSLSFPVEDQGDFDNKIIDLIDIFGCMFGITMARNKDGWY